MSICKYHLLLDFFEQDFRVSRHCNTFRFEQEEAFFALNVTVKNATLQDSLDQFVKGEILDGDNAYNCEKCSIKVEKHLSGLDLR